MEERGGGGGGIYLLFRPRFHGEAPNTVCRRSSTNLLRTVVTADVKQQQPLFLLLSGWRSSFPDFRWDAPIITLRTIFFFFFLPLVGTIITS